jgi:hypothetical protein
VSNSERDDSLLTILVEHGVDFVVVGGMAAVLHGAPVVTNDLDIVHSRSAENIDRLLVLLNKLDARYRGQPRGRLLRPSKAELCGNGHLNLQTSLGPLDLLCEIDAGLHYEDLIPHTVKMGDECVSFYVLGLAKLIEIKKATGRAKDRLSLPLLIAVLEKNK